MEPRYAVGSGPDWDLGGDEMEEVEKYMGRMELMREVEELRSQVVAERRRADETRDEAQMLDRALAEYESDSRIAARYAMLQRVRHSVPRA